MPAACFHSNDEETFVAAKQEHVGYCDDCRPSLAEVERGDVERLRQRFAHPDDLNVYDESEADQIRHLQAYITKRMAEGKQVADDFDQYLLTNSEALQHIQNSMFRALLSEIGPEKYNALYLAELQDCTEWLVVLQQFAQQRAPHVAFAETYRWVFGKAERAAVFMGMFADITVCLDKYQASSYCWNGSEAQLAHLVDMFTRMHTRSGPEQLPANHFMSNRGFTPSSAQLKSWSDKEIGREMIIGVQIEQSIQATNGRAGKLNRFGLTISVSEGLLHDEQAIDIEINHVPVSAEVDEKAIIIEDEYGNKLIWVDQQSTVVFANQVFEPYELSEGGVVSDEAVILKSPSSPSSIPSLQILDQKVQSSPPRQAHWSPYISFEFSNEAQPTFDFTMRGGRKIAMPRMRPRISDVTTELSNVYVSSPVLELSAKQPGGPIEGIAGKSPNVLVVKSLLESCGTKRKHTSTQDLFARKFALAYSDDDSEGLEEFKGKKPKGRRDPQDDNADLNTVIDKSLEETTIPEGQVPETKEIGTGEELSGYGQLE